MYQNTNGKMGKDLNKPSLETIFFFYKHVKNIISITSNQRNRSLKNIVSPIKLANIFKKMIFCWQALDVLSIKSKGKKCHTDMQTEPRHKGIHWLKQ